MASAHATLQMTCGASSGLPRSPKPISLHRLHRPHNPSGCLAHVWRRDSHGNVPEFVWRSRRRAFHGIDLSLRQSPIALRPSPSRVKKSAVHVVVTVEVWGCSLIGLVTILFHAALCTHCTDATNSHSVRVRWTSFVKFQILSTINYRLSTWSLLKHLLINNTSYYEYGLELLRTYYCPISTLSPCLSPCLSDCLSPCLSDRRSCL